MPAALQLDEMTLLEKLQLMEALWQNLSRSVIPLNSPEWHRDVLEEREKRIVSGEARFIDWKQAKVEIRERIHGD
jgi:Putative addiction module component